MAENVIDRYLATVPEPARASLQQLRNTILSLVPDAEEVISYQVPTIKYAGHPLVSFAAAKKHCSFYGMSPAVTNTMQKELAGYDTSPGTIRFPFDKPLPATLVKKIIRARMKETDDRWGGKAKK